MFDEAGAPQPEWQPVLLGALFGRFDRDSWANGERRAAGLAEVERRAQAYGLPPIRWPDPFPGNTLFAMRAATFAKEIGRTASFALAAFRQAFAAGPRPLRARQRLPRRGLVGASSALAHGRGRARRDQAAAPRDDGARRRPRGERRAERRLRRRGVLGRRPARGRGPGRRFLDSPRRYRPPPNGGGNGEGVGADDRALEARAERRAAGRRGQGDDPPPRARGRDAGGALAGGPAPPRALAAAACARALADHPRVNATYRDGRVESHSRVNVAISLAAGELAVAPTISDADRKSAAEIEAEIAELAERARAGALRAPELSGATFTVVDLTGTGVRASTPIVVPGQAAALTLGDAAAGEAARLVFACDARIAPWPVAAPFVAAVKALLEAARGLRPRRWPRATDRRPARVAPLRRRAFDGDRLLAGGRLGGAGRR